MTGAVGSSQGRGADSATGGSSGGGGSSSSAGAGDSGISGTAAFGSAAGAGAGSFSIAGAATGSTGDGYALAHALGHTIEPVRPSLVPLETSMPDREFLYGLHLRNISAKLLLDGTAVAEEFGEMSFSPRGVEGAVVLRMSRTAVDALIEGHRVELSVDLKPALDEATRARYRSMYAGVFYQRYILGLWVMSEGLIYDMFDQTENVYRTQERPVDLEWVSQRTVACDYGTANPTVFLDIYDHDGVIRVDREYRWDSRKERRQKTDQEYADDLLDFLGREWCAVIVDPSAASFIEELRRRGVYVIPAENEVLDGIRKTGSLFHRRKILVSEACAGLLDELGTYLWDEKAGQRGDEKPLKERDHGPDALRYYINSLPDWRFE